MLVPLFKQIARCLNSSHFQACPGPVFVFLFRRKTKKTPEQHTYLTG